jgi:hypothetical protein
MERIGMLGPKMMRSVSNKHPCLYIVVVSYSAEPLFSDSSFYLDYAGGKGIFMRNLAILNDDGHGSGLGPTYDEWITNNASAVWNNQLPNGNFHYWWEKKQDGDVSWGYPQDVVDAVLHASGQSALTACIPYMENQTILATASVHPPLVKVAV